MRIAQVACVPADAAGGIATGVRLVGKLLAGQHEITDFTPGSLRPLLRYGHGAFLPQLLWRLPRFDYIYLHYPFFGTAEVVWLFKLLFPRRPKLIIHYHMDVVQHGWIARIAGLPSLLLRRALLNQSELIVSASLDYVKSSRIKKYYQAHPEKFREIPFGLDLNLFQPKTINRPAATALLAQAKEIVHYINDRFIKKSRLDLLFVGGLDRAHYFKGVAVMLRALAGLAAANWHLTIIGSGDRKASYEKMAADLGLTAKIEFAGYVSEADKIRAYQNADLLLLPSVNNNEAFGLVLIEALACGAPVIASDLPGVRRVFANYQEGLLAEPGSASDLKSKLEFIMNNEDRRREMATAARRLAEAKYDERLMARGLAELFNL